MSKIDILRALKDSVYRNSLSEEDQGQLPNIAYLGQLSAADLHLVVGGGAGGPSGESHTANCYTAVVGVCDPGYDTTSNCGINTGTLDVIESSGCNTLDATCGDPWG